MNKKKSKQAEKSRRTGRCDRAYASCIKRTGRWRGRKPGPDGKVVTPAPTKRRKGGE